MQKRASEEAFMGGPSSRVRDRHKPECSGSRPARGRCGGGGADVWKGLTGGMTVDPRRGPGERGTDRDVLGTRVGQGGTPRPRFPQAPGPRAPSLTGAGVSAGRRPRRRRRRRRSGETRGPDRKCRPLPLPGSPAPPACPPARKRKSRPSPRRRRGGAERGGGLGDREKKLRLRAGSETRTGKA